MSFNADQLEVYCADLDARGQRSGECGRKLTEREILLIGNSFKCAYCRGFYFTIRPMTKAEPTES